MVPLLAAGCAAFALWCSFGALAVARGASGSARIGFLPPFWTLAVLLLIGFAASKLLTRRLAMPLFLSVLLVLPWLPFGVPDAFVLWTGNPVIAVWAAVFVGVVAAMDWRMPSALSDPWRGPAIAAVLACALYLTAGFHLAGLIPGGDEPHYLVITQSVLKDGDLQIENNHARGDYREYFAGRLSPDYLRRGLNGQIYSIHAPGLPLVVLPAFAIGGYHGVVVFLSIVAAIGGALLWMMSYRLTSSSSAAWFAWAAGALTVPFFFQSFAVYPDGVGATLVLFCLLPLVDDRLLASRAYLLAIALCLSLMPWLHTRFAILSASIGLVLLLRLLRLPAWRSRASLLIGPPAVSGVLWLLFFRVVYGTFNPAAPYGGNTQSALGNIVNGLPALFFDQQFGVLAYAPVYACGVAGLLMIGRRQGPLARDLTLVIVPYLLATSMFYMWWGGSVSPARFIVPILPLLAVPSAWLWTNARYTSLRAFALTSLLVSIAITLSLVAVDAGRLAYNFRDGYSLAAERFSSAVDVPRGLPSFFRQNAGGATFRAIIWLIWIAAAIEVVAGIERRRKTLERAMFALLTPLMLAVSVMIALTVVWKMDRVEGTTPETSQLHLIEAYNPVWRSIGVRFAPLSVTTPSDVLSSVAISTPYRRPLPPPATLLLAPAIVPAGDYELRFGASSALNPPSGTAGLVIGRMMKPINVWDLSRDVVNGALNFTLPVNVGSLTVEGDDRAAATRGLTLHPKRLLGPSERLTSAYARRAQRYDAALVFLFDDGAFPEANGMWIRAATNAALAIVPLNAGELLLRNAPVNNTVVLDLGGNRQTIELLPGEQKSLPLPSHADRSAFLLSLRTSSGFRPSEVEPGSTDNRMLGVWVELR